MTALAPTPPGRGGLGDDLRYAFDAVAVQWRVLCAVFFKEAQLRRGRAFSFGWLIAGLEPLIIVGAISTLFVLLNRAPAYGTSMLLFTGTGVFPMYLVIYTSMRVREPIATPHAHRYPLETPLDEALVHGLLHLVSTALVATGYFYVLAQLGVRDAIPFDPMTGVEALGGMFVLGVGLGLINSVISRFVPIWASLWPGLVRALIHFSGLYIVADYLPPNVRGYFDANPVLNGVNWFRHAFYPHYPDATFHPHRVMLIALITLVIGIMLERVLRRGVRRGDLPS